MANSKVEIIGNQLSGTIMNAASEATLQEIVRAVGGMNKTLGSNKGGGPMPSPDGGTGGGGGSLFSDALEGIGAQLGNIVGAVGTFTGLLANNNTKLSSYTSALNDQVVKNIPLVGKFLGTFGDVINYTIGQMESWNESLKSASQSGATFGNSILRIRQAANDSYLSLDDFVSIVKNNSQALVGFGRTVTEGAEEFARYNKLLKGEGGVTRDTLRQIGYSSKDVSEALMKFMINTQRGAARKTQSDKEFEKQFLSYEMNLAKLRALTGIQAQKLEEQMAIANQDLAYQLKKSELDGDEQTKLENGLAQFVSLFGPTGAEIYKAMFLNQHAQSTEAINLLSLIRSSGTSARDLIKYAVDKDVKLDQYDDILRNTYAEVSEQQGHFFRQNRDFVSAISSHQTGQNDIYKSLQGAGQNVIRLGGPSKAFREKALEAYDKAAEDLKQREALTQFFNAMNIAFEQLKNSLMDAVLPMLSSISETLKSTEMQKHIKEFGEALRGFILNSIPVVSEFFRNLGTEDGRKFIMEEMEYLFDNMIMTIRYAFGRAWYSTVKEQGEKKLTPEDEARERKALNDARNQRFRNRGIDVAEGEVPRLFGAGEYVPQPAEADKGKTSTTVSPTRAPGQAVTAEQGIRAATEEFMRTHKIGQEGGVRFVSTLDDGNVVTSKPGWRASTNSFHAGTDRAPTGQAKNFAQAVYSAREGTAFAGTATGYGRFVSVYDPVTNTTMLYAHLDDGRASMAIQNAIHGQQVAQGQQIGYMGNTGGSSGRHLHEEMRIGRPGANGLPQGQILDTRAIIGAKPGEFRKGTQGADPPANQDIDVTQMENIAKAGASIPMAEMISTFNGNMQTLITLTKERQDLHQRQLEATGKLSKNLLVR